MQEKYPVTFSVGVGQEHLPCVTPAIPHTVPHPGGVLLDHCNANNKENSCITVKSLLLLLLRSLPGRQLCSAAVSCWL